MTGRFVTSMGKEHVVSAKEKVAGHHTAAIMGGLLPIGKLKQHDGNNLDLLKAELVGRRLWVIKETGERHEQQNDQQHDQNQPTTLEQQHEELTQETERVSCMKINAVKSAIVNDELRRFKAKEGHANGFNKSFFAPRFTDIALYEHQHAVI